MAYTYPIRAAFRILLKGGGQNSCFRIPGGASATCCTLQYIYSKISRGGKHSARGGGGGECPCPPKNNPAHAPNIEASTVDWFT